MVELMLMALIIEALPMVELMMVALTTVDEVIVELITVELMRVTSIKVEKSCVVVFMTDTRTQVASDNTDAETTPSVMYEARIVDSVMATLTISEESERESTTVPWSKCVVMREAFVNVAPTSRHAVDVVFKMVQLFALVDVIVEPLSEPSVNNVVNISESTTASCAMLDPSRCAPSTVQSIMSDVSASECRMELVADVVSERRDSRTVILVRFERIMLVDVPTNEPLSICDFSTESTIIPAAPCTCVLLKVEAVEFANDMDVAFTSHWST